MCPRKGELVTGLEFFELCADEATLGKLTQQEKNVLGVFSTIFIVV